GPARMPVEYRQGRKATRADALSTVRPDEEVRTREAPGLRTHRHTEGVRGPAPAESVEGSTVVRVTADQHLDAIETRRAEDRSAAMKLRAARVPVCSIAPTTTHGTSSARMRSP